MTLKATVPAVEFGNFSLKVLGELTVEPDVMFNGVVDQVGTGMYNVGGPEGTREREKTQL